MENSGQHWITKSYLEAWTDPNTPPNHENYLWLIDRDGATQKNKAPKKVFKQSDFYTMISDNGSRDLSLEKKLSEIESGFISLRRHKLDSMQDLTLEDRSKIIIFVSTMLHRTKSRRDCEQARWGYALELMDDLAERIRENPSYTPLPRLDSADPNTRISNEDIRKTAKEPIQSILIPAAHVTAEILAKMDMHIVCAPEGFSFITSDNPGVIFDPLLSGEYHALGCPSIEVTLPISPKQLIIFFLGDRSRSPEYAYTKVDGDCVCEFNRRTRHFCDEYFVSNDKSKWDFNPQPPNG